MGGMSGILITYICTGLARLYQYIGGYTNLYIASTMCFMLLDGATIFGETI